VLYCIGVYFFLFLLFLSLGDEIKLLKMQYYSGILPKKMASNVSYMLHRNGPVSLDYKIWGVVQRCMYGGKICDICDLQKCLTQTLVDFEQNVIELRLTSGAKV